MNKFNEFKKKDIYDLYNHNNIENFCQEEYNNFLSNFTSLIVNYYSESNHVKDANTIYNIEEALKNTYEAFKSTNLELSNIKLVKNIIFNKILNINKKFILSNDNIICILFIINKNIKELNLSFDFYNEKLFYEIAFIKNNLNEKKFILKENKIKYKTKIKNFIEIINEKFIELNILLDDKIKNIKINNEEKVKNYIENYNNTFILQKKVYYLLIIFIIISLINIFISLYTYIKK